MERVLNQTGFQLHAKTTARIESEENFSIF